MKTVFFFLIASLVVVFESHLMRKEEVIISRLGKTNTMDVKIMKKELSLWLDFPIAPTYKTGIVFA